MTRAETPKLHDRSNNLEHPINERYPDCIMTGRVSLRPIGFPASLSFERADKNGSDMSSKPWLNHLIMIDETTGHASKDCI